MVSWAPDGRVIVPSAANIRPARLSATALRSPAVSPERHRARGPPMRQSKAPSVSARQASQALITARRSVEARTAPERFRADSSLSSRQALRTLSSRAISWRAAVAAIRALASSGAMATTSSEVPSTWS